MYAYADQNFLISCTENPAWRDALVKTRNSGKLTMVLSPWHFYEIGRARSKEDLLELAELINPKWILERSDLQLAEFLGLWNSIWFKTREKFIPIGSIEQVAATLHRTSRDRVAGITVRDYVVGFAQSSLRESLAEAGAINRNVRTYSEAGMLSNKTKKEVERSYVAVQIARSEGHIDPTSVYSRVPEILASQPLSAMIEVFIDWQLLESLKAFKVEKELSQDFYKTPAVLNANRVVDRQHAVAALSYCDYFVTDDQELRHRCQRAAGNIPFKVAEMLTADEFINRIKSL
jgi:hypothetical protein